LLIAFFLLRLALFGNFAGLIRRQVDTLRLIPMDRDTFAPTGRICGMGGIWCGAQQMHSAEVNDTEVFAPLVW